MIAQVCMQGEVESMLGGGRLKREDTIGFSACCRILFGTTKIVLNWSAGKTHVDSLYFAQAISYSLQGSEHTTANIEQQWHQYHVHYHLLS